MATLDNVLQQLREERDQAQSEVDNLQKAISSIESLTGRVRGVNGTRPKRTMSAAARRRIAQAQRARWAKQRSKAKPAVSAKASAPPAKRTLSPEGRKRIAAAARARWAREKAQKAKKAA